MGNSNEATEAIAESWRHLLVDSPQRTYVIARGSIVAVLADRERLLKIEAAAIAVLGSRGLTWELRDDAFKDLREALEQT